MATGGQAGKTPRMKRHSGGVGGLQGAHSKVRRGLGRSMRTNTKGSTSIGSGRSASPKGGARGRLRFPTFRGNTKGTS